MTINIPEQLAGHWLTPDGYEKAKELAGKPRCTLYAQNMTDFEVANAIYLDPQNIVNQTVAKERIRWLSVQLAIAEEKAWKYDQLSK